MIPKMYQTTIANGVRIVSQPTPGLQGAAIAIHVDSGSRDENPLICGASHFIEHLLFKGTEKRSSFQITSELDAMGVDPNAGTSQEGVTYYLNALHEYLPKAFEILCDMFLNSTFPEHELETERTVILEEIKRASDSHDRSLSNRFCSGFWNGHPLGRPVAGFQESVSAVSRDDLIAHMHRNYLPSRTIVTASGNVEHEEIVAMVDKGMRSFTADNAALPSPAEAPVTLGLATARHTQRSMEQVQLYLGYPALPSKDKRHRALSILNSVLGVGMGSRLFREVREVRGLAYSVGSSILGFSDLPALIVYAGCDLKHAQETIDICHREVMRLTSERLSEEFLADAKRQARGRLLLSLDDPESQVMGIAYEVARIGRAKSVAEDLEEIEAVTTGLLQDIAEELFSGSLPRLESIGPDVQLDLPS